MRVASHSSHAMTGRMPVPPAARGIDDHRCYLAETSTTTFNSVSRPRVTFFFEMRSASPCIVLSSSAFTMKGTNDAMGGEVQGTTLLTRPDVIAKKPATVQKMVNALVKANKFITSSSGEELAKSLPKELAGDPKLYAESFEHAREGFPPDSLISREGVARVIETMRVFEAVPAGLKIEPESLFDNRYVLKALGR